MAWYVPIQRQLPYSLLMLWRDRFRFLPALLAVAFSAVLIAVQCGLVMGLVLSSSVPIDYSRAQIWVLPSDSPSLQQSFPFPSEWRARVDMQPEVNRSETFLFGMGGWRKPGLGHSELCLLIGANLDDQSLGALTALTPEMRTRLAEPGTIIVDAWELENLSMTKGTGEVGEINGKPVRVVGLLNGFQGHNFIYIFCSQETARALVAVLSQNPTQTMGIVASCYHPDDVERVVARMRRDFPDMGVYTHDELSHQARVYWLFRSRGGTVMICTIILSVIVGVVITSQTLYAAVVAQLREFAVLDALGIPRGRLVALVMMQSFWLGLGGVLTALPITYILSWAALLLQTRVILMPAILLLTIGLTLGMAMLAGLSALRPLRTVEPANLLR